MDLIERFRYIMKLNNLTASAFADEINVQRSSVSHILSGRNKPSLEFIQKVISKYPKVDAAWLINGTTSVSPNLTAEDENTLQNNDHSIIEEKDQFQNKKASPKTIGQQESKREIERIVIFYSDQSFEEFRS